MTRLSTIATIAACLAWGCNDPSSSSSSPPSSVSAPLIVKPTITWPPADQIDPRAVASLGDRAEAQSQSPVPILAPTNVNFERPTFVVDKGYYALTGRVSGVTIAIQGTRPSHRYPDVETPPGDHAVRKGRGFVTENEGIRTVSWIENGAAYSVDVECADLKDARCASDAFVLDVTSHLGFAGGVGR